MKHEQDSIERNTFMPTDIAGVVSTAGTYFTTALAAIGIPVILWVIGKRVVKKSVG